jgi:hypothetical protein
VANGQYQKSQSELEKPVTLGLLLEFTDEVLLPKMSELIQVTVKEEITGAEHRLKSHIREEIAGVEHRMKTYIDRKLSDHTADLFKRLDERYQKDKQFKQKVVELLRRHNIGASEDIAFLEGLAQ